jgi:REP-associated tyrosine transposase
MADKCGSLAFPIKDEQSYLQHREYIAQNPVKAGLVDSAEKYPYCYTYLAKNKAQGLKPKTLEGSFRRD